MENSIIEKNTVYFDTRKLFFKSVTKTGHDPLLHFYFFECFPKFTIDPAKHEEQ